MLRAAPPFPSPSILVNIIPVKSTVFLNSLAIFTASCPVKESATKKVSIGLIIFLRLFNSLIITLSICVRPAVSKIITSEPDKEAAAKVLWVISIGSCPSIIGIV